MEIIADDVSNANQRNAWPGINADQANLKNARPQALTFKENSKFEKLRVGKAGLPPLCSPTELLTDLRGASPGSPAGQPRWGGSPPSQS